MQNGKTTLHTGRSPYGERGLKSAALGYRGRSPGRSPYGERGLKIYYGTLCGLTTASLPSRGAWIEKLIGIPPIWAAGGRAPYGERGLKKTHSHRLSGGGRRRSPYGERGLKNELDSPDEWDDPVAPLTGSVD